ncbi:hypothetical protein G7Z17_g2687 [Cylindrodendrum hubeiense]|uniref:Uncharacterized protein n=1 Tax=Cylindrodendrum hubeiense TaxID=595255 RepID=A0A9P5HIB3_9HYPO|nr:hypothetical protein G7Z17_g2687 [Cylindrodendrum hubeiense]
MLAQPETASSAGGRFWTIAQHIQGVWASVAQRHDVAAANELRRPATGFIVQNVMSDMNRPPSEMKLYLNYVSDPAGSKQFKGVYEIEDNKQTRLTLERYQLVTEERTPKLSCRSHSWNEQLTLSIAFNIRRHEKSEVQDILDQWKLVVEQHC